MPSARAAAIAAFISAATSPGVGRAVPDAFAVTHKLAARARRG